MSNNALTNEESLELVCQVILEVMAENGIEQFPLEPETRILQDTQLDSMGLAIVVLKMEEKTGKDPFLEGFIVFQTVAELADLYAN